MKPRYHHTSSPTKEGALTLSGVSALRRRASVVDKGFSCPKSYVAEDIQCKHLPLQTFNQSSIQSASSSSFPSCQLDSCLSVLSFICPAFPDDTLKIDHVAPELNEQEVSASRGETVRRPPMLVALESLRIGQEFTCYRVDGIERRVRRVKHALFQVFDVSFRNRHCWHLSFELSARMAWKSAQYSDCVYRARGAFAEIGDAPRAHGYQSHQNILLKQRVFHDAKRRQKPERLPQLVAIAGGKH